MRRGRNASRSAAWLHFSGLGDVGRVASANRNESAPPFRFRGLGDRGTLRKPNHQNQSPRSRRRNAHHRGNDHVYRDQSSPLLHHRLNNLHFQTANGKERRLSRRVHHSALEGPDLLSRAVEEEPAGFDGFLWSGRIGEGARASLALLQSVPAGSQSGVFSAVASDLVGAGRREAGVESVRGSFGRLEQRPSRLSHSL